MLCVVAGTPAGQRGWQSSRRSRAGTERHLPFRVVTFCFFEVKVFGCVWERVIAMFIKSSVVVSCWLKVMMRSVYGNVKDVRGVETHTSSCTDGHTMRVEPLDRVELLDRGPRSLRWSRLWSNRRAAWAEAWGCGDGLASQLLLAGRRHSEGRANAHQTRIVGTGPDYSMLLTQSLTSSGSSYSPLAITLANWCFAVGMAGFLLDPKFGRSLDVMTGLPGGTGTVFFCVLLIV